MHQKGSVVVVQNHLDQGFREGLELLDLQVSTRILQLVLVRHELLDAVLPVLVELTFGHDPLAENQVADEVLVRVVRPSRRGHFREQTDRKSEHNVAASH